MSHYSFILSNMDPLDMGLKNSAYYRLGTVLYLEIKRGGGSMKSLESQQDIGCKSDFMNILMKSNKGCGQFS